MPVDPGQFNVPASWIKIREFKIGEINLSDQ